MSSPFDIYFIDNMLWIYDGEKKYIANDSLIDDQMKNIFEAMINNKLTIYYEKCPQINNKIFEPMSTFHEKYPGHAHHPYIITIKNKKRVEFFEFCDKPKPFENKPQKLHIPIDLCFYRYTYIKEVDGFYYVDEEDYEHIAEVPEDYFVINDGNFGVDDNKIYFVCTERHKFINSKICIGRSLFMTVTINYEKKNEKNNILRRNYCIY